VDAEPGCGNPRIDPRTTRPGEFKSENARLEPAIALTEASIDDVARQVGKATPCLGTIEQLDISQSPSALGGDQVSLRQGAVGCPGNKEVALVPKADIDARLQLVEECHALADQLDLLDVVELQPKRAGGDRSGQRCQRRSFFEDDCLQAGPLREVRRGATDDAPADDDEVGGVGR
jgi:hypothetical protein